MAIQNPKRPISADEYGQMIESGVLTKDDHVELIEGEIIPEEPKSSRHAAGVRRLNHHLQKNLSSRALVDVQNRLKVGDWSQPQFDLALLVKRADYYTETPTAADAFLIVEIADTSVAYDRSIKAPLYGRHEIREHWLLDLPAGILEVYRQPSLTGYRKIQRLHRGDAIAMEAFPDVVFSVSDLLGPVS
jgi:Uma2 family endonuclease